MPSTTLLEREADAKGAVEDDMVDIIAVDSWDALGYRGCAHEEHSGECCVSIEDDERLANNLPEEVLAGR
jgi:hypothetical protein